MSVPPMLHPAPAQAQSSAMSANHGGDRESQKDKGKRLGQACGACRKRKVVLG